MNTLAEQRELEASLITTFDAEMVAFFPSGGKVEAPATVVASVPPVPPEESLELWP